MDNHLHPHLPIQQHCQTSTSTKIKLNLDKPLFPNEVQKQLTEDKKIGESFFKQGELRLLHGDSSGIQFFDLSLQLDPTNYKLHYDQGLALLEFSTQKGHEKTLLLAAKRFKSSVKLNPSYFEGWHAWGNTLYELGRVTNQYHYYLEAYAKYKQAIAISKGQANDILSDMYWSFGCILHLISKKSKEPSDMLAALDAFEKAHIYQEELPIEFWHDYGYVNLDLGSHLNDIRHFNQGIHCFKNAVSLAISSYDSWLHLAQALAILYSFSHDEDHFTQASECYTTAAQLNSKDSKLWSAWAKLLKESGQLIGDTKRLQSSIEKCHRAHSLQPQCQQIICTWVEALSLLGFFTEKVSLIHDAQNKIYDLIESKTTPDLLHAYGLSLFCLGKYFNDLDFYYQAIEKFQEGLSLDRTIHKLWHALGYTYTRAALIDDEEGSVYEKAHRFYQKAISIQPNSLYYFDFGYSLLKQAEFTEEEEKYQAACSCFETALRLQKDSIYLHPDWLFYYGVTLDYIASFHEDSTMYCQAIEILNNVLIIDPEHIKVHYQLALVYTHHADATADFSSFQKALHHYKIAYKKEDENDHIVLDWGITLASFGDFLEAKTDKIYYFREAEFKMMQAAKLGNIHAYYHLACLYSLLNDCSKSLYFLKKAEHYDALPAIQELEEDDWLENVRKSSLFYEFLSYLEAKSSSEDV